MLPARSRRYRSLAAAAFLPAGAVPSGRRCRAFLSPAGSLCGGPRGAERKAEQRVGQLSENLEVAVQLLDFCFRYLSTRKAHGELRKVSFLREQLAMRNLPFFPRCQSIHEYSPRRHCCARECTHCCGRAAHLAAALSYVSEMRVRRWSRGQVSVSPPPAKLAAEKRGRRMFASRAPCSCRSGEIYRVEREPWMRLLFPSRSLYRCANCGQLSLLTVRQIIDTLELRCDDSFTPARSVTNPANSANSGGNLLSN
jgi:hypothetical protein